MKENVEKRGVLTRLQSKAIDALVNTTTNQAAAELAGCAESSIYQWMKDPIFRAELLARENRLRDATGRRLAVQIDEILDIMIEIARKETNGDDLRLRACRAWADYWIKTKEQSELERRVSALEARDDEHE
jgi:hypothetical protein